MYHFKIEKQTSKIWNSKLLSSPTSNFLQCSQFLGNETDEKIPLYISVLNEKNEIIGQLGIHIIKSPVLYSSNFFKKISKIFQFLMRRGVWVYGPIIHEKNTEERLLVLEQFINALNEICDKYDLTYVEGFTSPFDNLTIPEFQNFFRNHKLDLIDQVTFVADLSIPLEEIWNSVSKKTRGDVNRAKRREIIVKRVESKEDLEKFLLLHKEWAKTKGLTIVEPFKEIENMLQNIKNGTEQFFLAFQNQNPISGLRLGCFNDIVYTHFVVSSYSESTSLGGTLLTWSAIEWAKNNGMHYYDFSGGTASEQNATNSLLFYKKKWGGKEIQHLHLTKINKKFSYLIYTKLFSAVRSYHNLLQK